MDYTSLGKGTWKIVWALFLVLVACSSDAEEASGTPVSTEISVTFGESMRYQHRTTSGTGTKDGSSTTLNGMDFEIRTDEEVITVRLGAHTFGLMCPGDEVYFSKSGIFVNGDRRWDMPLP
ncbi:MAG: hypothetical protein ACI8X5_003990 [Planctomycetota bacterium]|jgi:hypothetical protein